MAEGAPRFFDKPIDDDDAKACLEQNERRRKSERLELAWRASTSIPRVDAEGQCLTADTAGDVEPFRGFTCNCKRRVAIILVAKAIQPKVGGQATKGAR